MTTTTSTQSNPIAPSISSIDPQLLKLLARHQQHLQQQATAKEFLQHAFYFNHPPPNAVATLSPRTHLSNGLSKLNTENSLANLKLSSSSALNNGKLHDQQSNLSPPSLQMKKGLTSNAQAKDAVAFDPWLQPPPGSIIQGPPCIQADTKSSASSGSAATAGLKSETTLSSGERITCFVVGGERRLCLPEILNTVLKDFSLQEINSACERLHIYCSRCTTEQLDILKKTQVLPINAPSCGLITQTDAERLCANLLQLRYKGQLRSVNSSNNNQYERLYSIKVQHKCFGKCSGTLYPTLYVGPQAECIQCDTCQALFSPKTFVSHGHKSEENRICHWGFNSDNWRAYLKIRSVEDNKAREEFELFKEKFSSNAANNQKKRLAQHTISTDCLPTAEKRAKMVPPCTSDNNWSSNDGYSFNQSNYGSSRKEGSCSDYSFNNGLPRPNSLAPALPLAVPVESMSSSSSSSSSNSSVRPSPSRLGRSNSPVSNESTNSSSITNFNDFSPEGIRHMVESVVPSVRARQQLITYITQLQMNAYAQSSKNNAILNAHHQNEALQLRRENEILRERLAKFEGSHHSSNSSVCSKSSSNDHPHQQHESLTGDSDDVESNVSVHSGSSMVNQETVVEQPKYFDRKRRLLAAEQHLPTIEIDVPIVKKTSSSKKACLDEIVDSLNQRAQAERDEDEEYRREEEVEEEEDMAECQEDEDETPMKGGKLDDDEETEGMARAQNQSTPPSTTSDREDEETNDDEEEDVDIDEPKLTVDDDH